MVVQSSRRTGSGCRRRGCSSCAAMRRPADPARRAARPSARSLVFEPLNWDSSPTQMTVLGRSLMNASPKSPKTSLTGFWSRRTAAAAAAAGGPGSTRGAGRAQARRRPAAALRVYRYARLPRTQKAPVRQTLKGSFSAVSKRNFASKYNMYALESSRQDLHNSLLCTALKSHFF